MFAVILRLLALIAVLVGCAPAPVRPPVADPDAAFAIHRDEIERLRTWHLNGSLSVTNGGDGGQGRIDWHQREDSYEIVVGGPFGSGAARLMGNGEGATLLLPNGERLKDPDPQRLLYEQTGWWIPVAALRFWALGIPAPDVPARWVLNDQGRLATLEQDGWRIRFSDYRSEQGLELPGRLEADGNGARVKLLIRAWH